MGYTERSSRDTERIRGSITSVDLLGQKAMAFTRLGTEVEVRIDFPVGSIHINPAVGEHWYLVRVEGAWRLESKIPFNDPVALIEDQEGQVKVGSGNGPVELVGSQVNVHSVMKIGDLLYRSNNGQMEYSPDVDPPLWTVVSTGPQIDADGFYILTGVPLDDDNMYDPRDLLLGGSFDI